MLFIETKINTNWLAKIPDHETGREIVIHIAPCSECALCLHFFSPVPSISWKRADGATFGRKVDVNKASGVLEILYFQQEDAGLYECVAENSRGRNSVKGKLSFYGGWEETFNVFVLLCRDTSHHLLCI